MMIVANPACAEDKVIPSRSTLGCQIIRLADLAKNKLKQELLAEGSGVVALTHDIWTGENHRSYMAVTGHSISKDFELRRVTLDFRALPGDHTSKKIAEVLEDVVKEWDVGDRCIAMTSDNASSNVAAMEYLCRGGPSDHQPPLFFSGMHVWCLPHICNQAVQLALKRVLEIKEPMGLLRDLASFIGYSPKRTASFEQAQRDENAKAKLLRLRQDNEVRWGSTSLMLEGALHLKHIIINYIQRADVEIMKGCIEAAMGKLQEHYSNSKDELWVATFLDPSFKIGYFQIGKEGLGEEGSGSHAAQHAAVAQILELVRAKVRPYKEKALAARRKRDGTGRGGGAGRGRGETGSGGASSSGREVGFGGSRCGSRPATDAFGGAVGTS
ncbi:unnamed protein product [Closterium sp. Naga37s-1]|nr:unnamed protein product [Closterium sp. Naga37s-1]